MKKTLAILMVAIIAVGSVFAGVNFSGAFDFGYNMYINDDGFDAQAYGNDGNGTEPAKFTIKGVDDDGIFSVTLKYLTSKLDSSGKVKAKGTVDLSKALAKAYDLEMPVTLKVSGGMLEEVAGNRADADVSGAHWARVRSASLSYGIQLDVAYDKYVKVTVAGDPVKTYGSASRNEFFVNAIVTPVDGVSIAGAYARVGDKAVDGEFNIAAKVDIQKLADLDFSIVGSVAYRQFIDEDKYTIDATVSAGFDKFGIDAEYAMDFGDGGENADGDPTHKIYFGANTGIVEGFDLGAYIASGDIANFGDDMEIGATVGYEMGNIGLSLLIGYASEFNSVKSNFGADTGFNITPSFSVSF